MRCRAIIMMLVGVPAPLVAQDPVEPRMLSERFLSLTAGVGNSMGWFGAQAERYFLDERLSIFVGLGYTPSLEQRDPEGPTLAAGLRTYTSGAKHRVFMEGSVSQLVVESGSVDGSRLYGPGVQGGYQFLAPGGFTLMASIGVGYALSVPRGLDPWAAQVGLGVGYTWRRVRATGERFQPWSGAE